MSFVISSKQHLAPTEDRIQYEPIMLAFDGVMIHKLDISFGHPLYTAAVDILYIALEDGKNEGRYIPILPDGCMALVFKGKKVHDEPSQGFLCGTIDEIKRIYIGPEDYYVFIRFMPGTGYSLIKKGKNAGTIANTAVSIKGGVVGEEQILPVLERDITLSERAGLISKVVRVNLQNEPERYIVNYCTERIFQSQGNVRVEELAHETGFTSRHIGKLFERCIGVSPKLYSQIIKLQTSMGKIVENDDKKLVEIALDSGFFDHAHMNRMYKKLIGISSGEFKKTMFSKLDYTLIDDYISTDEA